MPVKILPPELANKIAAGEVVERPASAVKELFENSLDAGATEIIVSLRDAGKAFISVSDNGCGIPKDELFLAVMRHATSKINDEDDLFAISSYGFRGEALPSIASVSRFKITSRSRSDSSASFVEIEGGITTAQGECGAPFGTLVEASDLFYNVPARLKFLKKTPTELSHAIDAVTRLALLKPEVRVVVSHNGSEILNLPSAPDALRRAEAVFGRETRKNLYELKSEVGEARIWALISPPEIFKTAAQSAFYFYVNGRAVRDRILHQAVISAYGETLERGRYPLVALSLTLPPADVDVNVHPAKSEVRFRDQNAVFRAVRGALADFVDEAPWMRPTEQTTLRGERPRETVAPRPDYNVSAFASDYYKRGGFGAFEGRWKSGGARSCVSAEKRLGNDETEVETQERPARAEVWREPERKAPSSDHDLEYKPLAAPIKPGAFGKLALIGVLYKTYILAESGAGLAIIDQHAAHERVLFARLKERAERRGTTKIGQIFPTVVELGAAAKARVLAEKERLAAVGFDVEEMSGGAVALKSVPLALMGRVDPQKFLSALADEIFETGESASAADKTDLIIATAACHSAARAGDDLTREEIYALLESMDETDRFGYCPHGRPVMVEISFSELERRFGRRA